MISVCQLAGRRAGDTQVNSVSALDLAGQGAEGRPGLGFLQTTHLLGPGPTH